MQETKISNEIIQLVEEFYCNDEFSRQLPGKKDYVSGGRNQHMSKRLISCNLKELHAAFRLKYSDIKLGLSKFASLQCKWCILAGPKGMHSVCICTIHQNVKLILAAVGLESEYHSLIDMIVCSRDSKICMIH